MSETLFNQEIPDKYNEIGAKKTGNLSFRWVEAERIGDYILLTGKNKVQCILDQKDIKGWELNYERENSKCSKCYGTGERVIGWDKGKGALTKKCEHCDRSGTPRGLNK